MPVEQNELRKVREIGGVHGLMYVPYPKMDDGGEDEWSGHGAVLVYRPALVTQTLLDNQPRLTRMTEQAQRILISRLIQVVAPKPYPPGDLEPPDMTDSWPDA